MKKIQITARTRAPEPITQSVLDMAVERGKVLRLADWLEDQYDPTHNQWQAAALLRRLVAQRDALLAVVNKLEYSSDGYIKRYPEESEVSAALQAAKENQ